MKSTKRIVEATILGLSLVFFLFWGYVLLVL